MNIITQRFREKKRLNKYFLNRFMEIVQKEPSFVKRAIRYGGCADVPIVNICECGTEWLKHIWLCHDKMCPLCQHLESKARIGNMMHVYQYLSDENMINGAELAVLTMSVTACKLSDLADRIAQMARAWSLLTRQRDVSRRLIGYARTLEIKQAKKGLHNVHFHILMLQKSRIEQEEWLQKWAAAMNVDVRQAHVYVSKAYSRDGNAITAITEAVRYTQKESHLKAVWDMPNDDDLILYLKSISHKRWVTYGGVIRQARSLLNIKDEEDDDGVITSDMCPKCGDERVFELIMKWGYGDYQLIRYREFTKDGVVIDG